MAAADVAVAMLRHTITSRQTPVVNNRSPMAACTPGRGRAAMNAPLNLGGEVRLMDMEERKQSLAQAIKHTDKMMKAGHPNR